jgi:hypothetical protein
VSEGFSAFKAMALGAGALMLVVTIAPDIASGHFDPMRFAKGKNKNTSTGGTGGSTGTGTTTGDSTGSTGTGTSTGGTTTTNALYTEATLIPSNFDVTTTLTASWGSGEIPVSNAPDIVGAFRFICGAGQLSYDDPIVFPGQAGRSHLHQYYGNTAANANSTFANLRASGDSTCNNMGNGTAANRSAYWMPAMLDGKGNVIQPDYVQTYYKRIPQGADCNPATNPNAQGICTTIPNGLKFIFGYDMINNRASAYPGHFHCEGAGAQTVVTSSISQQVAYCKPGSLLVALIDTPKCWDGKNLDSADHRSHLSDMVRNSATNWVAKCPSTHPFLIPQFTLGVHYTVASGDDLSQWRLSSDEMHPELPHGSTFHADYFEAWDVAVKAMWTGNCIDKLLNCSGGDLGNGKQLKGAAAPAYGWRNPNRVVPVPKNTSTSTMASMFGM